MLESSPLLISTSFALRFLKSPHEARPLRIVQTPIAFVFFSRFAGKNEKIVKRSIEKKPE
jgi:hypothetical protein